jgi:hypothetical protein
MPSSLSIETYTFLFEGSPGNTFRNTSENSLIIEKLDNSTLLFFEYII